MNLDNIFKEECKRVNERGSYGVPNHYVIALADHEQQDEVLYELTSVMVKEGLRPFHALDRWLHYHLDGSKEQILNYRGMIESSAVFDNYYEGVLAFDASALLLPINRAARETFFNLVSSKEISHHATIVVFLDDITNEYVDDFLSGLGKCFEYKTFEVENNKMRLVYAK